MKDILKAVIPVTIAVVLYVVLAEKGQVDLATGLEWGLLILTMSLVVYMIIRLFRRKKFPKS